MIHDAELAGSDLEGFWYVCKSCGKDGTLFENAVTAEMEGSVHALTGEDAE